MTDSQQTKGKQNMTKTIKVEFGVLVKFSVLVKKAGGKAGR